MDGVADLDAPGPGPPRRWPRRLAVVTVMVAVAVGLAVAVTFRSSPASSPLTQTFRHQRAQDFRLTDVRDPSKSLSLTGLRGKPVVVNFWASWCVPCRQKMPAFERVWEAMRGRVAFLGVNHEDARGAALKLLRQTGVRYPVASDPAGKTAAAYGLFGMPTTLFVAADGHLLARHTGQMSERDLRAAIDRLFPDGKDK